MKSRGKPSGSREWASASGNEEQGFMLLGLIVAIAIILLFLGVAASDVAYSLRREKELESARRADQYVRAIEKFSTKNGNRYPPSMEALENTNHVRYLRQRYVDPLTGQADYRLIAVGQTKTTVKGFFGQPLAGIGSAGAGGIGVPAGANGSGTTPVGGYGTTAATGGTNLAGTGGKGTGVFGGGSLSGGSSSGTAGSGTDGSSTTLSPMGSPIGGTGSTVAIGPIMGVGSSAKGPSILTVNGQTSYETWEFLYDPRVGLLKLAAARNAGSGIGQPIGTPTTIAAPPP